jgi:hypothetical protein
MKIHRFNEYSYFDDMTNDFISSINEKKFANKTHEEVLRKLVEDLKLNASLITTFGAAIGGIYPIVEQLMRNFNISSIEISKESIILLSLAAVSNIYLEEKNHTDAVLRKDIKSMLEELRMKGIGNGFVEKLSSGINSIFNVFKIIAKYTGKHIVKFVDMFAYTSLMIPVINGILFIIDKYNLNLDTLVFNFAGLSMGVGTLLAKNGIIEILKRIGISKSDKEEVLDEINLKEPSIPDGISGIKGQLIKEQ